MAYEQVNQRVDTTTELLVSIIKLIKKGLKTTIVYTKDTTMDTQWSTIAQTAIPGFWVNEGGNWNKPLPIQIEPISERYATALEVMEARREIEEYHERYNQNREYRRNRREERLREERSFLDQLERTRTLREGESVGAQLERLRNQTNSHIPTNNPELPPGFRIPGIPINYN